MVKRTLLIHSAIRLGVLSFLFQIISSCLFADEQVLFNQASSGDAKAQAAFVLKKWDPADPLSCQGKSEQGAWVEVYKGKEVPGPEGGTLLKVSVVTTGKGAQFRRWEPQDVALFLDGKKINPCDRAKIYVSKDSVARTPAVVAFVALGTQYEGAGEDAAKTPGTACSHGGSPTKERGRTAKAIDRTGMAAGLGLLASQSKGEITGAKLAFDVTDHEPALKNGELHVAAHNPYEHKTANLKIPFSFDASLLSTESMGSTTVSANLVS